MSNLEVFNHFWIKLSEWKELGSHLVASKSLTAVDLAKNHATEFEEYIRNEKKIELLSKKCT